MKKQQPKKESRSCKWKGRCFCPWGKREKLFKKDCKWQIHLKALSHRRFPASYGVFWNDSALRE
jgi:hypothetical protein